MDRPLRTLTRITRAFPPVWGVGAVANVIKRAYARKPRGAVDAEVLGFRLTLRPNEFLERELLFTPQLYDRHLHKFMLDHLGPGDTFLDAGANIGMFSLLASRAVGPKGRVMAVEANPATYERLVGHLRANRADNVVPVHAGLADEETVLKLHLGKEGLGGTASFVGDAAAGSQVDVRCSPLAAIMDRHGFDRFRVFKMDIEGFEHRVLKRFFADAGPSRWPEVILIERLPHAVERAGGDSVELLKSNGYRVVWRDGADHVLIR